LIGAQQIPSGESSPSQTIRVTSSLVLVDVIATDMSKGLPANTLKRDDFALQDNKQTLAISTFDSGAEFDARPVSLWLIVLCNMRDREGASELFAGHANLLKPALRQLDKHDSVGIAHWCDDGHYEIDLKPTQDADAAVATLENVLQPTSHYSGGRTGEVALQRMFRLILQNAHKLQPQPLPVLVFLYGDWSGMPFGEVDDLVKDLLETSAIVYGIRDSRFPTMGLLGNGERAEIIHYIVEQTGGQYLPAIPERYADALALILLQLHFRYELGFKPPALDGKRHKLSVKLTESAQTRYKHVRLRYRPFYIPTADLRTDKAQ
jgi:hypothetical protein